MDTDKWRRIPSKHMNHVNQMASSDLRGLHIPWSGCLQHPSFGHAILLKHVLPSMEVKEHESPRETISAPCSSLSSTEKFQLHSCWATFMSSWLCWSVKVTEMKRR
ncbi:hypothetical protein Ancab_024845 [Ancistrocladus abbreviatus]